MASLGVKLLMVVARTSLAVILSLRSQGAALDCLHFLLPSLAAMVEKSLLGGFGAKNHPQKHKAP